MKSNPNDLICKNINNKLKEVRYHSSMFHKNIIRYHTSWIEKQNDIDVDIDVDIDTNEPIDLTKYIQMNLYVKLELMNINLKDYLLNNTFKDMQI